MTACLGAVAVRGAITYLATEEAVDLVRLSVVKLVGKQSILVGSHLLLLEQIEPGLVQVDGEPYREYEVAWDFAEAFP